MEANLNVNVHFASRQLGCRYKTEVPNQGRGHQSKDKVEGNGAGQDSKEDKY